MLPSASHHLPRIGLFKPKDVRDLAIRVVERLSKDVRSPFRRRQPLQQHQNPQLQRLASFRSQSGVGARVHWFGQPGSHVPFPTRAR